MVLSYKNLSLSHLNPSWLDPLSMPLFMGRDFDGVGEGRGGMVLSCTIISLI